MQQKSLTNTNDEQAKVSGVMTLHFFKVRLRSWPLVCILWQRTEYMDGVEALLVHRWIFVFAV